MRKTERARRALCTALAAALLLASLAGCGKKETTEETAKPKLSYAEGAVAVEDPEALQKAVDEMVEKAAEGSVALEYKNDARSEDGVNFSCYIANSSSNSYDMFISLYGDAELTEELYVSQLLRPGSAFDSITLDTALEAGEHVVYCAFTQVEEDLETIHAQVAVTLSFSVFK